MSVIQLTKENFQEKVLDNANVTLVDFYAVVAEIAEENPQFTVGKINTDEQRSLAEEYSIFSIPTLMIFKDGVVVDKQVGACGKEDLLAKLNNA